MVYRAGRDPISDALAAAVEYLARHLGYPALQFYAWKLETEQDWREVVNYLQMRHNKDELAELCLKLMEYAQPQES